MKSLNLLLLLILPFVSLGQNVVKGIIIDAKTQEPLAFANVYSQTLMGTVTDAEGHFSMEVAPWVTELNVSYIGYEDFKFKLEDKPYYTIKLKPVAANLSTVVVLSDSEDPAVVFMKKVVKAKPRNDYRKKLDKYSYEKYFKFLVSAEVDSINSSIDTVFNQGEIVKLDSSLYNLKSDLADKDIFLMESVMKTNSKNGNEKNKVIASRTAGFKNPMYELLAVQVSAHNVYDDKYKILIKEYLGPISRASFGQYKYELDEEIEFKGRKVQIVSYKNTVKPLISGKILVDMESLAIAQMTLNTYEQIEMQTIHQFDYHATQNVWFPIQANMKIKKAKKQSNIMVGDMVSLEEAVRSDTIQHSNENRESDYMFASADTKYFKINFDELHKDKIKYDMQVAEDVYTKSDEYWAEIRGVDFNVRANKTYGHVDSLFQLDDVEEKINRLRKGVKGKFPLGIVDVNIVDLIDINEYEGLRFSLGGKTNEKLSAKYSIEGYGAYGFKDKGFKYQGKFNYKLNHQSQTYISASYRDDLQVVAGYEDVNLGLFHGLFDQLATGYFYRSKQTRLDVSTLLTKGIKANIGMQYQVIPENKYTDAFWWPIDGFDNDGTLVSIKGGFELDLFSKFFLSPTGRQTMKEGYPKIYLNFEKTLPALQDDDYDMLRLDLQMYYKKKYLNNHYSEINVNLGFASKEATLIHKYSPRANAHYEANKDWYNKIHFRINPKFETMRNLEFYDNFVSELHFRHTFNDLKVTSKYSFDLSLVGRAAWSAGDEWSVLKQRGLEKGYYEAGIEFNRLVKIFGQGLGAGFYYRMGPYAFPEFKENVAFKLTVTLADLINP